MPQEEEILCDGTDLHQNFFDCVEIAFNIATDSAASGARESAQDAVFSTITGSTSEAIQSLADLINIAVARTLDVLLSWIVSSDTLDVTDGSAATTVSVMGDYLSPIVFLVAALGIIVAAAKMVLTRKANPLLPLGTGLLVLVGVQAFGLLVVNYSLVFADQLSQWIISGTRSEELEERLVYVLTFGQYTGEENIDPNASGGEVATMWGGLGMAIILGIVVLIIAAVQVVLSIFREAVIIILAAALPLAAAGMLMKSTSPWFHKVSSWIMALVMYKPTVAFVYGVTFTFITGADDLKSYFSGLMMLIISLVALPFLVSLFSWATGSVAGVGTPGGGGVAGLAMGALGTGTASAAGGGAAAQAASTNQRLGAPEAQGASAQTQSTGPGGLPSSSRQNPDGAQPGSSGKQPPAASSTSTSTGASESPASGAIPSSATPGPRPAATGATTSTTAAGAVGAVGAASPVATGAKIAQQVGAAAIKSQGGGASTPPAAGSSGGTPEAPTGSGKGST